LFEVDELRSLYASLGSDLDESWRFEECAGVGNRRPLREMDDPVRIVLIPKHLIRTFSRLLANARSAIEDSLPGRIVGDFVNDEHVLHESGRVADRVKLLEESAGAKGLSMPVEGLEPTLL